MDIIIIHILSYGIYTFIHVKIDFKIYIILKVCNGMVLFYYSFKFILERFKDILIF